MNALEWAGIVLAALVGTAGCFVALCLRAPDARDVWEGGEPSDLRDYGAQRAAPDAGDRGELLYEPPKGIAINPGREW